MGQQAIELRDVCKKRRNKTIGPMNLRLPQGYITALVGQNGAGKSTLLNMLLQLILPDEGEIRWYEETYRGVLPMKLRQTIAYVPEMPQPEENFWTPVEAAAFRSHWYPSWDQSYFEELIQRFEVPQNARLGKVSKGSAASSSLPRPLRRSPGCCCWMSRLRAWTHLHGRP